MQHSISAPLLARGLAATCAEMERVVAAGELIAAMSAVLKRESATLATCGLGKAARSPRSARRLLGGAIRTDRDALDHLATAD